MDQVPIEPRENQALLKASQIANILNISKAFAYKLMQTGQIRSVRIAGARRVRHADLDAYIQENLQPPIF